MPRRTMCRNDSPGQPLGPVVRTTVLHRSSSYLAHSSRPRAQGKHANDQAEVLYPHSAWVGRGGIWALPSRTNTKFFPNEKGLRTSRAVQWIKICLPMQGTQVQFLVQEASACCRAAKALRHNYRACAIESVRGGKWSYSSRSRESRAQRRRASTTKIKLIH